MKHLFPLVIVLTLIGSGCVSQETTNVTRSQNLDAPLVSEVSIPDTGQTVCFNDEKTISCPKEGEDFYGQDGNYSSVQPGYTDNDDGTITDTVTGLMWTQNYLGKDRYDHLVDDADTYTFAGYSDWRVPSIKELYSLIDFSGKDVDPTAKNADTPFINTDYFDFSYGDMSTGDRVIDSQWITTTLYVSTVMNQEECFFGVNFADGRIKCYPTNSVNNNGYYARLVRGDQYGINDFANNNDGTILDNFSQLMWQQNDSEEGMDWENALAYCEDLNLGGYTDWRLPNAKELQSIVDYTRSPDTTDSPAIDPMFTTSSITNEAGQKDYPFFWTGTTHENAQGGESAAYVSFGRALGNMQEQILDVHGAGAQRSDPKSGDIEDYPQYFGPQGDVRRLYNYARCVR